MGLLQDGWLSHGGKKASWYSTSFPQLPSLLFRPGSVNAQPYPNRLHCCCFPIAVHREGDLAIAKWHQIKFLRPPRVNSYRRLRLWPSSPRHPTARAIPGGTDLVRIQYCKVRSQKKIELNRHITQRKFLWP